nr:hypothetical protein [Tepidanaerobacter acetatoxydans]
MISITCSLFASLATIGRLLKKMVVGGEKFIPTDTVFVADDAGVGGIGDKP